MEFLKRFDVTPKNVLKVAGIIVGGLVVLAVLHRLLSPIVGPIIGFRGFSLTMPDSAPSAPGMGSYDGGYAYENQVYSEESLKLSTRNIGIPVPPSGSIGGDAEEFEATEYGVSIETLDREKTCATVAGLKARDYVVFENANEFDTGCNFTFKVERERAAEILAILEELNPKDLSESTYTIKRQIDDFTSEEDILKGKLASIDETLTNALEAYDDITALATRTEDAESLAKIIDSKIDIIERLTQERLNTTASLERLSRAKAEQLDRLEYTYFHVNVYENKFIDPETIKDSWKTAVREFVQDVNRIAQSITVGLAVFLVMVAQYLLYAFILLFAAKYVWRAVKRTWQS